MATVGVKGLTKWLADICHFKIQYIISWYFTESTPLNSVRFALNNANWISFFCREWV